MNESLLSERRETRALEAAEASEASLVPYDENLLDRARTQWHFGDWESLVKLSSATLQHHPDRAKLALLVAAGQLQIGNSAEARNFIRLAQDWGINKKLVSRILVGGVHNSLGRSAAIIGQHSLASQHFEDAIAVGTPGADAKLLSRARNFEQLNQLGLPTAQFVLSQSSFSKVSIFSNADKIGTGLKREVKFEVSSNVRANVSNCLHNDQDHSASICEHKTNWLDYYSCENLRGFSQEEIEKRLKYGSYVGDLFNYVFVETPKAACSSIKWILYEIENRSSELVPFRNESTLEMAIHYRDFNKMKSLIDIACKLRIELLKNVQVVRFCVVRNPYSRLVSSWANKIRQREPGYDHFCCEIAKFNEATPDNISFSSFARWVVEKQDPKKCNPHWRPMTNLLLPEIIDYTHVLHTENITEELQDILNIISPERKASELLAKYKINESIPVEWKKLYNKTIADMVYSYYKEDFVFYGYPSMSWKELDHEESDENDINKMQNKLEKSQEISLKAIQSRNLMISKLHEALHSK